MKRSALGPVVDFESNKLERLVAKEIVKNPVPIRGKELKILRSATGLSMNQFARKLGVTSTAIYHWEKSEVKQLLPVNEIAVRVLSAEQLGVELLLQFSNLIGLQHHGPVVVQVTNKKVSKSKHTMKTIVKPSYRGNRQLRVRVKED